MRGTGVNTMKRKQRSPITKLLFFTLLALAGVFAGEGGDSRANESIKVGVFQNKPIVYYEDGPKGLFVDVLDYIAGKENWEIEYVECELKNCLALLEENSLDLMTS